VAGNVRGAVLAGGTARRYAGRPKGLQEIGGRRILDRVVEALTVATGAPPVLIANDPGARAWRPDLRTIPDVRQGMGSLGGIYTAVVADSGAVLCVAWDMPFVTPPLLTGLVEGSIGFDAFLPESVGAWKVEPLCAVYGPACAPVIARHLERGDLQATGFHGDVKVGTLPIEEVRRCGEPEMLFFNVNRPADLRHAERVWARRVRGAAR
jgi:molybdopterin-guanine dinucleotide biosynthesis protein A